MSTLPVYAPLPLAYIRAEGPDIERFLQGQCSCDVAALSSQAVSFGTCNTPKGRMVALFRIRRWQGGFLLRVHQNMLAALLTHLAKYQVFFKCELTHDSELKGYGLLNTQSLFEQLDTDHWMDFDGGHVQALPGKTRLFEYISSEAPENISLASSDEWLRQAALSGLPELFPATQEAFILQHLNLHELGGVSFSKGCYTGQEIIARMKYLGKLKKRMFVFEGRFDLSDSSLPEPGAPVYTPQGEKAGQLVQIQGNPSLGWAAQAVCDINYPENQRRLLLTQDSDWLLDICPDS